MPACTCRFACKSVSEQTIFLKKKKKKTFLIALVHMPRASPASLIETPKYRVSSSYLVREHILQSENTFYSQRTHRSIGEALHTCYVILHVPYMSLICPYMSLICPLYVSYMSLICALYVPYMSLICPLYVPYTKVSHELFIPERACPALEFVQHLLL